MRSNIYYLNIADFCIKIVFKPYEKKYLVSINKLKILINKYFAGFISKPQKKIDFQIDILKKTPYFFQRKTKEFLISKILFYQKKGDRLTTYQHISISQFMFLIIDVLQQLLIKNNGFIIHGSAIEKNHKGIVFAGKSGAGKSTIVSLLKKNYKVLGDDSVIIRKNRGEYYLYQTPLIEKNYWIKRERGKYKIGKIFFLKKAPYFKKERILNKRKILYLLTSQVWSNKKDLKKITPYLIKFINNFNNFYLLFFEKNKTKLLDFIEDADKKYKTNIF